MLSHTRLFLYLAGRSAIDGAVRGETWLLPWASPSFGRCAYEQPSGEAVSFDGWSGRGAEAGRRIVGSRPGGCRDRPDGDGPTIWSGSGHRWRATISVDFRVNDSRSPAGEEFGPGAAARRWFGAEKNVALGGRKRTTQTSPCRAGTSGLLMETMRPRVSVQ